MSVCRFVCVWTSEWMSEWVDEWVSGWVEQADEWVSELGIVRVCSMLAVCTKHCLVVLFSLWNSVLSSIEWRHHHLIAETVANLQLWTATRRLRPVHWERDYSWITDLSRCLTEPCRSPITACSCMRWAELLLLRSFRSIFSELALSRSKGRLSIDHLWCWYLCGVRFIKVFTVSQTPHVLILDFSTCYNGGKPPRSI